MSKQLSLPLKTHHTRACKASGQVSFEFPDPSWINEFVARYEMRYKRKKKSKPIKSHENNTNRNTR